MYLEPSFSAVFYFCFNAVAGLQIQVDLKASNAQVGAEPKWVAVAVKSVQRAMLTILLGRLLACLLCHIAVRIGPAQSADKLGRCNPPQGQQRRFRLTELGFTLARRRTAFPG
jgi:hypothetical protein